jgi:hypothetical protein
MAIGALDELKGLAFEHRRSTFVSRQPGGRVHINDVLRPLCNRLFPDSRQGSLSTSPNLLRRAKRLVRINIDSRRVLLHEAAGIRRGTVFAVQGASEHAQHGHLLPR